MIGRFINWLRGEHVTPYGDTTLARDAVQVATELRIHARYTMQSAQRLEAIAIKLHDWASERIEQENNQ